MKIVYSGLECEGYNPKRRYSFEYNNFYLQLKAMPGADVIEYPFDAITSMGKVRFNRGLLDLIDREKPDLFFAFMYTDEFDAATLETIKQKTKSVAWFADDHWRIWNYSRHWVPHFTWGITTWSEAPAIYKRYGITNVIRSQWGANPDLWRPVDISRDIDVSFTGQRNSSRNKVVGALRRAGINVVTHGWGWPEGRLSSDKMVESFSRTKINLNFNTPPSRFRPMWLGRMVLEKSRNGYRPSFDIKSNALSWWHTSVPQIKARSFEILACRTFLISGFADDMDRYYEDGKEIVYYDGTTDDLAKKISYYLEHDEEREKIANAGYARTISEHTYEKRFHEIFDRVLPKR